MHLSLISYILVAIQDEKIDNLIAMLRKMNDDLNIPHCIKNYGEGGLPAETGFVSEEEFKAKLHDIAANAIPDACTGSNPRIPTGRNGKTSQVLLL